MKKNRAIVLRTAGTNCDAETVTALVRTGFFVDCVHINELVKKDRTLEDYSFLVIPGGFSYGDDIASGRVFANKLKFNFAGDMQQFIRAGKLIIGICNGFQVLVKSGFLPGEDIDDLSQSVSLTTNDSDLFEDRWVYLKKNSERCVFTCDLPDRIFLPVAHGEGKFIYGDPSVARRIRDYGGIVFQYVDDRGFPAGYPHNPNGSFDGVAGICNPQGTVLGMMPHPERFITKYQHPRWTREPLDEQGVGLKIFRNAYEHVKNNL